MKYAQSVLDLIGHTPLVKLNHVTDGIGATVLVKLEYLNPGGSIKDRIAAKMIDEAERDGKLLPGGTIVEPTSGNTGVGLALVAQQKGYRCIFVVPDKVGEDKRAVLQAYGAEVVVTPTAVPPDSPQSYYGVSDRLVTEIPGAYKPDQFSNPAAPASHYETTGPEIWHDTDGRVTHCVIGAGTGGTITGTGRYLQGGFRGPARGRRRRGQDHRRRPGGLGLLRRHRPAVLRRRRGRGHVAGQLRQVRPGRGHRRQRRRLLRHDPPAGPRGRPAGGRILRHGRGGRAAGRQGPAGGRRRRRASCPTPAAATWPRSSTTSGCAPTASSPAATSLPWARCSRPRPAQLPDLVHIHPNETVRDVINIMNEYGVSHIPVLSQEPPVVMGEVLGAVDERTLTAKLFRGEAKLTDKISEHMGARLPVIGSLEPISAARRHAVRRRHPDGDVRRRAGGRPDPPRPRSHYLSD